jgi:hypothetical protein
VCGCPPFANLRTALFLPAAARLGLIVHGKIVQALGADQTARKSVIHDGVWIFYAWRKESPGEVCGGGREPAGRSGRRSGGSAPPALV